MKIKPANKTKGILLIDMDGDVIFRVYDKKDFTDYTLAHTDLQVVINDVDAYFYEKEGEYFLDHSPETLGIKKWVELL